MTPLRQQMIEDMQIRGLAKSTQVAYVRSVRQLAEYFGKSPAQITDQELRQYLLYLRNDKHAAASTFTVICSAIKFLYRYTLKRTLPTIEWARAPKERKLPAVFSVDEVHRLLGCIHKERYRACLGTIYACGLRLREGIQLRVRDIDSARMLVHVQRGKGSKDRYVPLPQGTLDMLRRYWATHRNPTWLFPGKPPRAQPVSAATIHVASRTIQFVFHAALREAGIQKPASVHTLRHSYATHLYDAGVDLRQIQAYLGHSRIQSTTIYVHLSPETKEDAVETINQVIQVAL
jgi:site-specific recombinase XerD